MKKILVFVLAVSATLSFAQTQLTNLEFPDPMPSNPNQFFTFKGELYFIATDGRSGAEIWKSDGTVQNTILLKDLNLGRGNSVISNFVEFKDKMYFVASDGIHGYQLWSTTGSSQGTIRITEDLNHAVQELLVSGEFIYFLKKIGNSLEVWKSDGTATGTTLVKELVAIWNSPANLTSALGLVFFSAQPEGTNDTRVWRTDGTDEGTFPITAGLNGNGSGPSGTAHPTQFIEYNGALYLVARSSQLFPYPKTVGILKTDGTVAGTQPVLGIHEGNMDLIEYGEVVLHQNKLYFSLFDVDRNRYFIWESMGTSGTTKKIYDYSSDTYFSPSNLCASGNNLLFTSGNASGGTSLVNFDLVTSTPQVLNELTGPLDQPFFFWGEFDLNIITKGLGSDFFIKAIIDGYGAANLWRSNGTATGAIMLSDIYRFGDVKFFNDRLYFAGLSEENFELCSSDGTQSGTSMLKEINASVNGFVLGSQFIKVGNQVVFAAYTEEEGSELWTTDGTAEGTKIAVDLRPGPTGTGAQNIVSVSDLKGVFIGITDGGRSELYATDGTGAGTSRVSDFFSLGANVSSFSKLTENILLVVCRKPDETNSLYKFDLSQGATEIINFGKNIYNSALYVTNKMVVNGTLYFMVDGGGGALWKSDGTNSGTVKIKDVYEASNLTAAGDLLYFTVRERFDAIDQKLYRSDGTTAGTVSFATVPDPPNSGGLPLYAFGNKIVFTPTNLLSGKEVWITDGSESNTTILKDINDGAASGVSDPGFVVQNGILFFTANDERGAELWKSDGTPAGTTIVKDINAGPGSSSPNSLTVVDGKIYFSAYTVENGFEVWGSDGTEENTNLIVDVVPGATYSNPRNFSGVNGRLLFVAQSESAGTQLFGYDENVTSTIDEFNSLVNVYPNPSKGIFNVEAVTLKGSSLSVYNSAGTCVAVHVLPGKNANVDLNAFPAGLYFFRFVLEKKLVTVKVMKI